MAPAADKWITKAVELVSLLHKPRCSPSRASAQGLTADAVGPAWSQMVNSVMPLTAREAYEAVPQLKARGEKVLQNLNKRARLARQINEASAFVSKPAAEKVPKPKAKPLLPKGKRRPRSGVGLTVRRGHRSPGRFSISVHSPQRSLQSYRCASRSSFRAPAHEPGVSH